ncbi:hypothetical protein ACF08B_03905 [Streptomyces sp. NPDC015139]|uniref:hypothetical protein n=1 Tax=Streptomyces sp. NPDC015139 TaxID=3364942 RepID=UPI0036F78BE2
MTALIATAALVGSHPAGAVATRMAVGSGTAGSWLADPASSDNASAALAGPVTGRPVGILIILVMRGHAPGFLHGHVRTACTARGPRFSPLGPTTGPLRA